MRAPVLCSVVVISLALAGVLEIKAWKQRHWPVFITGSTMMLIFWAITPLQGAIFGQQSVTVSEALR